MAERYGAEITVPDLQRVEARGEREGVVIDRPLQQGDQRAFLVLDKGEAPIVAINHAAASNAALRTAP